VVCALIAIAPNPKSIAAPIPSTQPTITVDKNIDRLIVDLGSDAADRRQAAAQALLKIGPDARPALLAATKSDDPEVSSQAAALLLQMPWTSPTDPPMVREILASYGLPLANGATGIDARRPVIADLATKVPISLSFDALVRLAHQDPSDDVRWSIVNVLRTADDAAMMPRLRADPNPPTDNAPLAALYALAWLQADTRRAADLMRASIDLECKTPSDDVGEIDFLATTLASIDSGEGRYADAADVLRRVWARGGSKDENDLPTAMLELFALHADFGPFPGFEQDQIRAGATVDSAKLRYAMARAYVRLKDTKRAEELRKAAFETSKNSRRDRFCIGKFLADHGWDTDAEAELQEFLKMSDDIEVTDAAAYGVSEPNAQFLLSGLAAHRGDDQAAAEHKEAAMRGVSMPTADLRRTDAVGREIRTSSDEIWSEIHWRYLRAARKKGDQAAIDAQLEELLKLGPADVEVAMDVVPVLKSRNRNAEAHQFFLPAYQQLAGKLNGDPRNTHLMNDLAWLEAKCDERLDEALKLATAASEAAPTDYAILDTLAETHYHLGHQAEAIATEEKALRMRPGDAFMQRQLARFKSGSTRPTTDDAE
jgi:tetratricopeptide (TPR) repeat protein